MRPYSHAGDKPFEDGLDPFASGLMQVFKK